MVGGQHTDLCGDWYFWLVAVCTLVLFSLVSLGTSGVRMGKDDGFTAGVCKTVQ